MSDRSVSRMWEISWQNWKLTFLPVSSKTCTSWQNGKIIISSLLLNVSILLGDEINILYWPVQIKKLHTVLILDESGFRISNKN